VGNYTFSQTAHGLPLGKLAEIAAGLSAPFVATAAGSSVAIRSGRIRIRTMEADAAHRRIRDLGFAPAITARASRGAGRAAVHPAAAPWQSG
jgi:hypothetical protein